ncbi:hypothetical protein [Candidatus Phytoplasma oryzae]|nr:hypothetical protein PIE28_00845 [Candidatus Phytoplasma oryzae]
MINDFDEKEKNKLECEYREKLDKDIFIQKKYLNLIQLEIQNLKSKLLYNSDTIYKNTDVKKLEEKEKEIEQELQKLNKKRNI